MSTIANKKFGNLIVSYRPGTSDEDVLAHSFDNDIFFKRMPEYTPKSAHTIIDIGAHIGTVALLASEHLQKGKVFAFEPCLDTFRLLEKNKEQKVSAIINCFIRANVLSACIHV